VDFFRSFGRNWFDYSLEGQTYWLADKSLSGNERNELYRNDGGHFTRIGFVTGAGCKLDGRGLVSADFDRDGDCDLFLVNNDQPCVYLRNDFGQRNHWSVVQLEGTRSNAYGLGARITLESGGRAQVREVHAGSGYLSSPPPEAHFGLGRQASIDRLSVRWPSGEETVLTGVPTDRVLVVAEDGSWRERDLGNTGPPTAELTR